MKVCKGKKIMLVMISAWEFALFLFPIVFYIIILQIFYNFLRRKTRYIGEVNWSIEWLVNGWRSMSQPLPGFESTLRSRCFGTSQVLETGIYKMRGHTLNYLGLLIVKTPILKDFSMALGDRVALGPGALKGQGCRLGTPWEPLGRAQPHCSGSFSNAG